MATTQTPTARNWRAAEIDLATARLVALEVAAEALTSTLGFLGALERQQGEAMIGTRRLRSRREESLRDEHDAALRKAGGRSD